MFCASFKSDNVPSKSFCQRLKHSKVCRNNGSLPSKPWPRATARCLAGILLRDRGIVPSWSMPRELNKPTRSRTPPWPPKKPSGIDPVIKVWPNATRLSEGGVKFGMRPSKKLSFKNKYFKSVQPLSAVAGSVPLKLLEKAERSYKCVIGATNSSEKVPSSRFRWTSI
eukprot:1581637-Amphidinium_carterae.1